MLLKIGKTRVDVLDAKCPERPCYRFGYDKGTFVQGRGYTSYHEKPRPVCVSRDLHGCPVNSVCSSCRTACVDGPGASCSSCKSVTIALSREKT